MRHETFDLSAHNAAIFFDPKLPSWYAGQSLCAAETVLLIRYRDAFAGKSVLDLGVGSGRTTRYFLPFAGSYVGIDLSPPMLAACRARFPNARLIALDMRQLASLGGESFDFVFGAWAVIDAVTHEERLRVLAAIAGLVTPGGLFVFSAHNRRSTWAGRPPELERSRAPIRQAKNVWHYLVALWNFRRLRHLRREAPDHALLNDMAHRWQGVFYYIDRHAQVLQLAAAGFEIVEIVGEDGRTLAPEDDGFLDGCLHYVCRRRATGQASEAGAPLLG